MRIAIAAMCLFQVTSLVHSKEDDTQTKDSTNRVYELLADYQVNQEKVYKQGFAFVGKGVEIRDEKASIGSKDRWYLCVYESPSRRLDASSVETGHSVGRYSEVWRQSLKYDAQVLYKVGLLGKPPIDVSAEQPDDFISNRKWMAVPQPLKQVIQTSFGLSRWTDPRSESGAEYLLGDQSELLEGKYDKNGDILATFKLSANVPVTRQIRFGRKERFLPVAMIQKLVLSGKEVVHTTSAVEWKHAKDYSVPTAINYNKSPLDPRAGRVQFIVDFDWKVGDEVTEKIDPKLEDWRKPFRDLFDVDWQERGDLAPLR